MEIFNKKALIRFQEKNSGNAKLVAAINKFISDLESISNPNADELKKIRSDADKVHRDDFYFFDIITYRVMILIEMVNNEATVVWIGSHQEYDRCFKNNKTTIEKWLRTKGWIK